MGMAELVIKSKLGRNPFCFIALKEAVYAVGISFDILHIPTQPVFKCSIDTKIQFGLFCQV